MENNLLLATHNEHKVHEISLLFSEACLPYHVQSLCDIDDSVPIPEDGATLEENAIFKAREGYKRHGGNVLADDTGLEVRALGGRPGVYTARYAGEQCTADENITKLLHELRDSNDRDATFKTVLALILNGQEYLFVGEVHGQITSSRRGERGFGYDPIFQPEGTDKTFAELSEHDKNQISHRGRAIMKLIAFLRERSNI